MALCAPDPVASVTNALIDTLISNLRIVAINLSLYSDRSCVDRMAQARNTPMPGLFLSSLASP
eukprot:7234881-Heterocapsa_arctica.AAC.1